jgi:NAD-dependent DNA ligase
MSTDKAIDELIGLSKGLIADGVLTEEECDYLKKWLHTNSRHRDTFPISVLYSRVCEMLTDGLFDEDERRELFDLLLQITAFSTEEVIDREGPTPLPVTPNATILFHDKVYCFTGTFSFGPRKKCQDAATSCGARILDTVRQDLDYLVIGSIGSERWAHSHFGRKIERALHFQKNGFPIVIIDEATWTKSLPQNL